MSLRLLLRSNNSKICYIEFLTSYWAGTNPEPTVWQLDNNFLAATTFTSQELFHQLQLLEPKKLPLEMGARRQH